MTSSPRGIIRGAEVEGVLFCTPIGTNSSDPVADQERDNLKALEEFWHQKGVEEGRKSGFEEGMKAGEEEGFRKGLQEGEAKGLEAGHAAGKEEGFSEGKAEAMEEVRELIVRLELLSEQLKDAQQGLYEEGKAELISFSIRICEQVIRQQLGDSDFFKKVLSHVIQRAQSIIKECPVEIYLSREEHGKIEKMSLRESLSAEIGEDATTLRFLVDETFSPGDCRLETPLGLVNFDLSRLLADLERKVLEVRSDDEEEGEHHQIEPSTQTDGELEEQHDAKSAQ